MSTIRVRRLDDNWDPVFGNGRNDYLLDIDAVSQILRSRLLLWLEEWWEDQTEGLPMTQQILGKMGTSKIVADRLIQTRISETPYVTGITSFVSTFDVDLRKYTCQATVTTEFGAIVITNA